jgi:DNA polymerase-3 subunit gamma/tau
MAVLYRKYRPQTFADVVGQKHIVRTLKNQVLAGSVAHAYLFTGSRGVGKTSIARILAKAVNCEVSSKQSAVSSQLSGDPCGKCNICKQIEGGQFLDLVEIDAASNTGVDNIRELIEHVKFSPSLGKFKVFIIDEVHMLSKGAFNALLKTLEEPPKHAIFVLATTEINKVPATIISRTQRFDFKTLSESELEEYLERILKAEKSSLHKVKLIAGNSEGSARDALSLLEKVLTLGQDATAEECRQLLGITDFNLCRKLLELIATGNMTGIPPYFSSLLESGTDFVIFNRDFLDFLREVLVFKVTGGHEETAGSHQIKDLSQEVKQLAVPELIFIVRLFLKSYKDISYSPREEISLLVAALEAGSRRSDNRKSEVGLLDAKAPAKSVTHQPQISSSKTAELSSADEKPEAVAVPSVVTETQEDIVSLPEVRVWWPKIIEQMKKINQPLANLIRTASLEDVSGRVIILGVKFNFDKQNLESHKNKALMAALIHQVSGKNLAVRAQVTKAQISDSGSVANLGEVLKVFGGELID